MQKFWDNPRRATEGGPATQAVAVPACLRLGAVEIRPATVLAPIRSEEHTSELQSQR